MASSDTVRTARSLTIASGWPRSESSGPSLVLLLDERLARVPSAKSTFRTFRSASLTLPISLIRCLTWPGGPAEWRGCSRERQLPELLMFSSYQSAQWRTSCLAGTTRYSENTFLLAISTAAAKQGNSHRQPTHRAYKRAIDVL